MSLENKIENRCYIVNPSSQGGKAEEIWETEIKPLIKSDKHVYFTEKDKTTELVKKIADKYDVFVCVGGDGTAMDIANAIVDKDKKLAKLPLGSGNDVDLSLGLIKSNDDKAFGKLLDIIDRGRIKEIDVCKAYFENKETLYLANSNIGLSAEVLRQLRLESKNSQGASSYQNTLLKILFFQNYKPFETEIKFNGNTINEKCLIMAVNNMRSTGGGMLITPNAKFDDGYLDFFYAGNLSKIECVIALTKVRKGTHIGQNKIVYYDGASRITSVEINTNPKVYFGLDGEVTGTTPAKFEIYEKKLKVIC